MEGNSMPNVDVGKKKKKQLNPRRPDGHTWNH